MFEEKDRGGGELEENAVGRAAWDIGELLCVCVGSSIGLVLLPEMFLEAGVGNSALGCSIMFSDAVLSVPGNRLGDGFVIEDCGGS